jgi:hypothetical protein
VGTDNPRRGLGRVDRCRQRQARHPRHSPLYAAPALVPVFPDRLTAGASPIVRHGATATGPIAATSPRSCPPQSAPGSRTSTAPSVCPSWPQRLERVHFARERHHLLPQGLGGGLQRGNRGLLLLDHLEQQGDVSGAGNFREDHRIAPLIQRHFWHCASTGSFGRPYQRSVFQSCQHAKWRRNHNETH